MRMHIYLIRNLLNGKGYVGQTTTGIATRFTSHKSNARLGSTLPLHCAMRKYGVQNFAVIEIASCDSPSLLNELEQHYISRFETFAETGHGYNLTSGGAEGYFVSEETRNKQSSAKKGKPAWNKGKPSPQRGRKRPPFSEEWKAKISATLRGSKMPESVRANLIAINTGRMCSEETRAKIAAAKQGRYKGVPWTEARRNAMKKRVG